MADAMDVDAHGVGLAIAETTLGALDRAGFLGGRTGAFTGQARLGR